MKEASGELETVVWRVEQCPFLIEYDVPVLEELRSTVMDAFFSVPRGGAEVGGLLFGTWDGNRLHIQAARPLDCEHAFGPSFVLSERDHKRFAELLETPQGELSKAGLVPVGWYHSHTRSEIFLSDQDLAIHDRYFSESWHVALVLRPASLYPTRAGFFFREANGTIHSSSSYQEFALRPAIGLSASGKATDGRPGIETKRETAETRDEAASALVTATEAGQPAAPLAVTQLPPPESVPLPSFLEEPPERSRRYWLWALTLLCVAAAFVGFGTRNYWIKYLPSLPARPESLALQALDTNGQLQIRWDRSSKPIREARDGTIQITDGPSKVAIPLDQQTLRTGSLTYVRQSQIVDVHLTVREPDGSERSESVSFIGKLSEPQPQSDAVKAQQERDQLAAESAQMRDELTKQEQRANQLQLALERVQRDQQRRRMENQTPAPFVATKRANSGLPFASRASTGKTSAGTSDHALAGHWILVPSSVSKSPFKADFVTLTISERQGIMQGTLSGHYRAPRTNQFNPQLSLRFEGATQGAPATFAWTGTNGTGRIEFKPLPGRKDAMEVVWYPQNRSLVFDDIFIRTVNAGPGQ